MIQVIKETHQYILDGTELTPVNDVLVELGIVKPMIRTPYIDECAEKGKAIHKIAELACKGSLDESSIDDRLMPYYRRIEAFLQEYKPKFMAIEKPVYALNWLIAGTPDFIAEIDGKIVMGDWKSGTTGHMWAMRVYAILCDFDIDEVWRIHLKQDGTKPKKEKIEEAIQENLVTKLNERVGNAL